MLIDHYDLNVYMPPDASATERFSAIARLTADISEVLPYLNATLHGAVYSRTANALTWKQGAHHVAFHADQVSTGNVEDYDTAVKEIGELINLINRTWDRRSEITPDYETRQRPPLMTVYQLLPQTNCKQCGEPTCYAFAIKLTASQKQLTDCLPLYEPSHAEQLAALQDLVTGAPAIG